MNGRKKSPMLAQFFLVGTRLRRLVIMWLDPIMFCQQLVRQGSLLGLVLLILLSAPPLYRAMQIVLRRLHQLA